MLGFLDRLRQKPLHIRKQIAFVTTLSLCAIIAFIWANSWNASHSPEAPTALSDKSPTDVIWENIVSLKEKSVSSWKQTMGQLQYESPKNDSLRAVEASVTGDEIKKNDIVYPEQVFDGKVGNTTDRSSTTILTATTTTE